MSFRLITILILLIFSSNCTTPKVKSDNATRSLSSAQNQFYQNIRKVVEEKINTSFFVKESVSNQMDFEFDLEMQTPLFKKKYN